ncbi:hypothetical protein QUV93_01550 [Phascolarctobacterium faecium]|nr:hypothetical protein [Phascolarctobacterium faecium]MDM8108553.1 hypothetical protein [Phascolarctobacterium faecium]
MPEITGKIYPIFSTENIVTGCSGAFTGTIAYDGTRAAGSTDMAWVNVYFGASKSNAIYGASDTVQPPAISLIPQLKF